ncbi:unnamed protein product [Toxocara canis]|uniref:Uncharacterized protein n=1 Tax=Toxocara canis TaxID=6265 RepID=A0A183U9J1_TOXCA|nr:unnamed protein product [Toxocara canis]
MTVLSAELCIRFHLVDAYNSFKETSGPVAVKLHRMYQKTFWQQAHLPYFVDLDREADEQFSRIKTGLAASIILRDIRPAFAHFIQELNK